MIDTHPIQQIEFRGRDLERMKAFYHDGLGWEIRPAGEPLLAFALTGRLPLVQLLQTPIPEVPPGVVIYAEVPDCAAATEIAKANGAIVIIEPTVAGTAGTWSLVHDPWGNELGFWQSAPDWRPSPGAAVIHPIAWVELRAPDLVAAVRFYRKVCGWSFQVAAGVGDFAFYEASSPGRPGVGVGLVGGERAARLQRTTVYAATSDIEASLAGLIAAGGKLSVEPSPGPEGGRFAVVADPDGNPIGLFTAAT